MATAIYVPRVNNNDDEVKIMAFCVGLGDEVLADQIVGQVETDKAILDVNAPSGGYVLGFVATPESIVRVGSILLWLGHSKDEAIPQAAEELRAESTVQASPVTAKARLLIEKQGLQTAVIPPLEGRVTVEAVERYLASLGGKKAKPESAGAPRTVDEFPDIKGRQVDLSREEKGMASTVTWHRDFAVPGYIEIDYEIAAWADFAKSYQQAEGLLMPPLLPLMAWQLVEIVKKNPRLNATMIGHQRFEYAPVNLGFTIQAKEILYLAVLRNAQDLKQRNFVDALGDVLRRAVGHNIRESEACGATISFSSMERWKVTRHIPILPPHSSLIVAHAAGHQGGRGVLGATYDHRVLNGGQVVAVLKNLAIPPK
jgi:pyruvate dehydrogenase E2 component (dihydrolipoamide acetyltransferase)